jgi:hypothetical protein
MNRFTRMLTMAGLGLATTVTLGVAPATAATSTEQGTAQAQVSADPWFGGDRVVGYFRSWTICDRAGEEGEDDGWWEDYDCVPVRSGFHNRRYALVVDYDDWGHGYTGHWGSWAGQWWPGNYHHVTIRPHRPGPGFPWIRPRPRPTHPMPLPIPTKTHIGVPPFGGSGR